ncbi:uncharacterized protein K441DRAFT_595421, partial [Cenococcum geophilum 1.58]
VYLPILDNRTTLIITKCVNIEGSAILPIVIIKGAVLLKRYFINLPNQYLVICSSSGYTNNKLSLK